MTEEIKTASDCPPFRTIQRGNKPPVIVVPWRARFAFPRTPTTKQAAPVPVLDVRDPFIMSDDQLLDFDMHPEGRGEFKVRPISKVWRYEGRRPAYRTAVANVAYIWRDGDVTDEFGKMPSSFSRRRYELRGHGLMLPGSAPKWAREGYRIWREADANTAATGDPRDASAWHVCCQIPDWVPVEQWRWFVTSFVKRELSQKGAAVAWAVHALAGDDGGWIVRPHVHLIVSRLYWRHRARTFGARHPAWLANGRAQARLAARWHLWCGTPRLFRRLKRVHATRWTGG